MTEKRFKLYEHKDNDYILDNPNEHLDFIEMLGDALTSEEIVNLLNELNDENEQLKQQMQRLYNYFADWFDEIVPSRNFSEMWDCVKEDEKWN